MRKIAFGTVTLWLLAMASTASAQQPQSNERRQVQPSQQQQGQPGQVTVATDTMPVESEWAVSGFAGPGFGHAVDGTEFGFGGSVAYLYNRRFGAEFLANLTPGLGDTSVNIVDSNVNNYMANMIAAVPLGQNGRVQPFVSGGLGAMRIRADVEQPFGDDVVEIDDTRLGTNVGVGLMWFEGRWGLRTDLRYFTALDDDFDDDDEVIVPVTEDGGLSNTNFWRYDLGVAYRW